MWTRKTEISLLHKGIELNIKLSYAKRKTLALTVYRDQRIELKVPNRCPVREIDAFLCEAMNELRHKPRTDKALVVFVAEDILA